MLDVCARLETVPKSEPIESSLALSHPKVTVRELISQYVASNEKTAKPLLVCPTDKENALNSGIGKRSQTDRNVQRALSAFRNNGFVLLVDNRQVGDLDDEVELSENSVVTFLRLTPLVGG